jgi:hypothetical protein
VTSQDAEVYSSTPFIARSHAVAFDDLRKRQVFAKIGRALLANLWRKAD